MEFLYVNRSRIASVLLGVLSLAALGSCGSGGRYVDGRYSGSAEGVHAPISVEVRVERGRIAAVEILSQTESSGVADLAFERIPAQIVKKQSTEVEAVAGASASSRAIMEAAAKALAAAEKR